MKRIIIALALLVSLTGPAVASLHDGWKLYILETRLVGPVKTLVGKHRFFDLAECVEAAAAYYESQSVMRQSPKVVVGCAKSRFVR